VRILITGAGGFAGRHLIHHLLQDKEVDGIHILGTIYGDGIRFNVPHVRYSDVDLRDEQAVASLVKEFQPQYVYHLAAQSSPSRSRKNPWHTLETNIKMQFNLLQACLQLDVAPRILIISSADIYCGTKPTKMPIDESVEFQPTTSYSVSKVTQDMIGLQYYLEYDLPIIRARPFNHIGRGQSLSFVAPDFAMQIAHIEAGLQDAVIEVGNLAAERDFTDVRDTVRAYALLMQKGNAGEAYNIASGKAHSIKYMLDTLLSYTNVPIEVRVDAERLRPIDVPIIVGDYSKLHTVTGWRPTYRFEDTLGNVLDDCRQRVQQEQENKEQ
jgi:GDP-4-dehydro-6-deoxy-D-mannose reductase